jgi:2-hydroxychromene-2-carboxylate isomerase
MKHAGNVPTTVSCGKTMKYASRDIARRVSRCGVPYQLNPHVFSGDPTLALKGALFAGERGVFGSPTFIVGEDVFFGNDRLEFLEERLRS